MLVPFVPDPGYYNDAFSLQVGHGPMVRYRGTLLQNGSGFFSSLLSRIGAFARPLLKSAMPHAKRAFEAATPHLREAVSDLVKDMTKSATEAISRKLSESQEGSGRKRKMTSKSAIKATRAPRKKLKTVHFDVPDRF